MEISPNGIKEFRRDFKQSVKDLEAKHGITLELGNSRREPNSFTVQLVVQNTNVDGLSFEEAEFKRIAPMYGLKESDYGVRFRMGRDIFRLSGINQNARKNIINMRSERTNELYSTSLDGFKSAVSLMS